MEYNTVQQSDSQRILNYRTHTILRLMVWSWNERNERPIEQNASLVQKDIAFV